MSAPRPAIRAAMDLQGGDPASAVRQQSVSPYAAAAEFWPQYLRGLSYLKLGRGSEAAAEFRDILRHRGYAPLSVLYALAHSRLAHASEAAGDSPRARG